ncbi:hypothetical protein EGM_20647 [Macaca fascicularis]|uniref:Fibrosin-1 n=1 Tax=Macaca fascicularis TaxID=9541 RepID=G8F4X0_MACFA|nr:hypothetical protein EGM_20647 [Macaca fascicularis]
MHVRVAYMILRHQEKMKGDSHKLDFRNDLLPCLPGPYGALPPGQELSHPASLFTATGAVHAAANPFTAAPGAHGPFLSPSTHIDPFGRPTSFASLAALSNGAFGGLGSPTFGLHLLFERPRPPPFLGPSPPDRCAGFLEPTWLAAPPRLARPPRFYEAGEELTGPGAVAAARLYGLEPAHPLLYSRLAPPPPPAAAPGTPHLLSKTPPGALLGAPPPLTFCTFLQGCPSQQSPSWLIKSSDWCCVPSLWPLCGEGRLQGEEPGRDSQASPWEGGASRR